MRNITNDTTELIDSEGDEAAGGRGAAPPERFNRRKVTQRSRQRARRSRSNEAAKRGMHQRRSKRSSW